MLPAEPSKCRGNKGVPSSRIALREWFLRFPQRVSGGGRTPERKCGGRWGLPCPPPPSFVGWKLLIVR